MKRFPKKMVDRSVILEIDYTNPKVKRAFERASSATIKWREKLEAGRRRARAVVNMERIKRGDVCL